MKKFVSFVLRRKNTLRRVSQGMAGESGQTIFEEKNKNKHIFRTFYVFSNKEEKISKQLKRKIGSLKILYERDGFGSLQYSLLYTNTHLNIITKFIILQCSRNFPRGLAILKIRLLAFLFLIKSQKMYFLIYFFLVEKNRLIFF